MGLEFPDWLRGIALIGKSGSTYLPVAVDPTGQLYIVLTGAPDITIPGTVDTNDLVTLKQIQGTDGTVFRTAKVDASGQFIMVPRGQSGNYMAVDATGYLTTVLKGLGAAGLQTIAVDNSGRMIGLIANVNAAWGYTQNESLANLAAALRPIQRWDRRGQILEVADFENGFPPQVVITHPGAETHVIDAEKSQSGNYCLKLTTTAAAGSNFEMTQEFRLSPASRFGAEVAFSLATYTLQVILLVSIFSGAMRYRAGLMWDVATTTLKYYNSAGAWINLDADCQCLSGATIFNHMKLVADFSTNYYMRAMLNEKSFSIPTQALNATVAIGQPHVEFYLRIGSSDTGVSIAYVDDWIITAEEPV